MLIKRRVVVDCYGNEMRTAVEKSAYRNKTKNKYPDWLADFNCFVLMVVCFQVVGCLLDLTLVLYVVTAQSSIYKNNILYNLIYSFAQVPVRI